jgi:hypothetical protein
MAEAGDRNISVGVGANVSGFLNNMGKVRESVSSLTPSFEGAGRAASKFGGGVVLTVNRILAHFLRLRTALAGLVVFFIGGRFVSGLISAGEQIENFAVQIQSTFGQFSALADKALERIIEFARVTPFSTAEVIQGFTMMQAAGLETSDTVLKAIGDTAFIFNRSFAELSQALLSMETEPLKRMGIMLQRTGDTAVIMARGIRKEVNNTRDAIFKGLIEVMTVNFGGAMESAVDTWRGAMANFKSLFEEASFRVGRLITTTLIPRIKGFITIFENLQKSGFIERVGDRIAILVTSGFGKLFDMLEGFVRKLTENEDSIERIIENIINAFGLLWFGIKKGVTEVVLPTFNFLLQSLFEIGRSISDLVGRMENVLDIAERAKILAQNLPIGGGALGAARMGRAMALSAHGRTVEPGAVSRQQIIDLIQSASIRHNIDPDLIQAVIQAESRFRPGAVSPKGAQGLMQLMPATQQRFGVTNPFDPEQNIEAGTKFLSELMTRFKGDTEKILAGYNAGPGNALEALEKNWPETTEFVKRVQANINAIRAGGTFIPEQIAFRTPTGRLPLAPPPTLTIPELASQLTGGFEPFSFKGSKAIEDARNKLLKPSAFGLTLVQDIEEEAQLALKQEQDRAIAMSDVNKLVEEQLKGIEKTVDQLKIRNVEMTHGKEVAQLLTDQLRLENLLRDEDIKKIKDTFEELRMGAEFQTAFTDVLREAIELETSTQRRNAVLTHLKGLEDQVEQSRQQLALSKAVTSEEKKRLQIEFAIAEAKKTIVGLTEEDLEELRKLKREILDIDEELGDNKLSETLIGAFRNFGAEMQRIFADAFTQITENGKINFQSMFLEFINVVRRLSANIFGIIMTSIVEGVFKGLTGKTFEEFGRSIGESIAKGIKDWLDSVDWKTIFQSLITWISNLAGSSGGGGGGGGLFSSLFGGLFGGLLGMFGGGGGTPAGFFSGTSGTAAGQGVAGGFQKGGIITRPLVGMFSDGTGVTMGERGTTEAVVPLPDNRSIPVRFMGGVGPEPRFTPSDMAPKIEVVLLNPIDPKSMRRTDDEIVSVFINGMRTDTTVRRAVRADAELQGR